MTDEITAGLVLKLSVRAMAHGGEGIADAPDGRVVFIAGAIPGDTVEARLTRVKKRWARAELVKVVDPSPHRVRSACPAAAAGAGAATSRTLTRRYRYRSNATFFLANSVRLRARVVLSRRMSSRSNCGLWSLNPELVGAPVSAWALTRKDEPECVH